MKEVQKKYKLKVKSRKVDFYIKDQKLYDFSKSINFNSFVKKCLQQLMEGGERNA